jgi:parvulin-like peptidyl-prolyl isomerase
MKVKVLRRSCWIIAAMALGSCSGGEPQPEQAAAVTQPTPISFSNDPLPEPLPEIAARVGDQPILLRNVRIIAERHLVEGDAEQRPRVYRQALDQLIVRELLFREAMQRHLEPEDAAVEQAYNEARVPYKGDETWAQFLAQQGLNDQEFRKELRIQFTVQTLIEEQTGQAGPVTDQEVREFYDTNPEMFESGERLRASHIQLRINEQMSAEDKAARRQRAHQLLGQIRDGDDFAELARRHSEDQGSAALGGELQVFHRGQMPPAFEEAAFALEPGAVSGVVETPFGFHIIKLHERLPSLHMEFDAAKDRMKTLLLAQKKQRALASLVTNLRSVTKIEDFLSP